MGNIQISNRRITQKIWLLTQYFRFKIEKNHESVIWKKKKFHFNWFHNCEK